MDQKQIEVELSILTIMPDLIGTDVIFQAEDENGILYKVSIDQEKLLEEMSEQLCYQTGNDEHSYSKNHLTPEYLDYIITAGAELLHLDLVTIIEIPCKQQ